MLDAFSYDKDMHFELINDAEGVSLERIDQNAETNNAFNWHSAAETVGWGTPESKILRIIYQYLLNVFYR